jgi:hypothetical protein
VVRGRARTLSPREWECGHRGEAEGGADAASRYFADDRSPLFEKEGREEGVVSADPASGSFRLSAIGKKRRGSRPVDEPFHRSIAPFTRRFAKD